MNFNSLTYLLFLAANLCLFYALPQKLRNPQLLLASYVFYACWNFKYAFLMLFSTAVTYACGLLVERSLFGKRKLWLGASLTLNLSVLFFFKYFNFTMRLLSLPPTLDVLLPVGISFYTFQALGYTIDVYRKTVRAERSFIDYALFVSFFPQLVAGPIERSGHMLGQLKAERPLDPENLRQGALPILWGLFKKMVLADHLAVAVNAVYASPASKSGGELLIATVAFAFQIYCDFSAYSDIARGSAKLFGFDLMENFNCPYLATSIRDFWRRWHISLSSWFRDYLYFPLGGSRRGKWRSLLNLLVVFLVSGLWHGAGLTFVAWGLLNGLYQAVSILLSPLRERLLKKLRVNEDCKWLSPLRIVLTFALVCAAWVLFRAESLSDAWLIYRRLAGLLSAGFTARPSVFGLSAPTAVLLFCGTAFTLAAEWLNGRKEIARRLNAQLVPRYLCYFFLIAAILLFGSYGPGYDPQAFVYFQF